MLDICSILVIYDFNNVPKNAKGSKMLKWMMTLLTGLLMTVVAPAQASTYVLVHGAWGGGNGYDGTAKALRVAGHKVYVVALKGLGSRAKEIAPDITLSTHVADVLAVIDHNKLKNIILVGHSYGGMIITQVAAKRGAKIASIVYIDAFLPKDGEALWDIATDWERAHYINAQRDKPGLVAPFPGAPSHLTRHPLLTLLEPVHLNGDEKLIKHHTYIYATRGAPKTFGKFYDAAKADPAWQTFALDSGHGVMQDQPDALNAILLDQAKIK
jgi:pimeloyl-ACP methyl ester carboxylesterase